MTATLQMDAGLAEVIPWSAAPMETWPWVFWTVAVPFAFGLAWVLLSARSRRRARGQPQSSRLGTLQFDPADAERERAAWHAATPVVSGGISREQMRAIQADAEEAARQVLAGVAAKPHNPLRPGAAGYALWVTSFHAASAHLEEESARIGPQPSEPAPLRPK